MNYGIENIESLDFREGVRRRVQMYLGSDDIEGAYQALKEIINNSTDEALAGFGDKIEIEINNNNGIRVRDYGRGVPFGIRENGENVLVSIFTKSHTGGKFNEDAYKNSSGLNGIGGSCVCLSSTYFDVFSYRDGVCAHAGFEKGLLKNYVEFKTNLPNGTCVEFQPDPEVFKNGDISYDFDKICQDIKDISYLYDGIVFSVFNGKEKKTYCAKNGILDFVKDNISKPLHSHITSAEASDGTDSVEIAFQWGNKRESGYVFVNGLRCPEGGAPITGAKTAITKVFNNLAKSKFDGELIRENLFFVINCKVKNPSFANQTKTKINNASLRTLASNAFTNGLKKMNELYPEEFKIIAEMLKKVERAEAAAEKAKKQVLETEKEVESPTKRRAILAEKLKDCKNHGEDSMLVICEGDSALGALVQGRPIDNIALIPIRGKIISALKNTQEDILKNEEVKAIFSALGCGFFNKYNAKKLRYGKVGIAADQDQDGNNIFVLVATLFYYMCPEFIKEGRLYRLESPLYVLRGKNSAQYAFSNTEKEKLLSTTKEKVEVSRIKGLGELRPEDTKKAVFGENKKWDRLRIEDWEAFSTHLELMMGKDVKPRREYIMNEVDFTRVEE